MPLVLVLVLVLVIVIGVSRVAAQAPPTVAEAHTPEPAATEPNDENDEPAGSEETFKLFEYGSKGLDIRSRDGNYYAHIEFRAQMRFTSRDFDFVIPTERAQRASGGVRPAWARNRR